MDKEIQELPTNGVNVAGRSVVVSIPERPHSFDDSGGGSGINDTNPASEIPPVDDAPEKKITLLAFRIAILEKAATGLGALGFAWATVVLLGGFASVIRKVDFWVITIILLIESARIFSRSRELEWQHQSLTLARNSRLQRRLTASLRSLTSSLSLSDLFQRISPKQQFRSSPAENQTVVQRCLRETNSKQGKARRTWDSGDVMLLPFSIFKSKNISRYLYWLQLASATACVVLSILRLVRDDYDEGVVNAPPNMKPAVIIFYDVALAEALMYLIERAYWNWEVYLRDLFGKVNEDCGFDENGINSIKRFYYDAYSRCMKGSIFDGLEMDLVTYGEDLLVSDSSGEQLIGARILQKFATNAQFSTQTLRKIETTSATVERLVDMLNWTSKSEVEQRLSAAVVVERLARKSDNSLRIAGLLGSMESISSLLYTGRSTSDAKPYEIRERTVVADLPNYEFSAFTLLGLSILKVLAQDHENCGRIGNTRGLLAKIIDLTGDGERVLSKTGNTAPTSQVRTMKLSLQIIKLLASATGTTGMALRHQIVGIVFTVTNIREILQFGEAHLELQTTGIEILTSLAMEKEGRERIGMTGGVIKELFALFFKKKEVTVVAGEALAMLALDSESNCDEMLRRGEVGRLVAALEDKARRIFAARILRNLCAYSGDKSRSYVGGVTAATPTVLKAIIEEDGKPLEASIGLAAQICKITSPEDLNAIFTEAGVAEIGLAKRLVEVLQIHKQPICQTSRIRRFVIELAILMMKSSESNVKAFKHEGLDLELRNVLDTTSALECFNVFSGSTGLNPHYTSMQLLVASALEMLC